MAEVVEEEHAAAKIPPTVTCCGCCGYPVGVCKSPGHDDSHTYEVPRDEVAWNSPNGTRNEETGEWGL